MAVVLNRIRKWERMDALKRIFTIHYLPWCRRENGKSSTKTIAGIDDSGILMGISETLESICERCEPEFLKVGSTLQDFYLKATELAQHTVDSLKVVAGEGNESVLVKVKDISQNALGELKEQRSQVAINLKDANVLVERLDGLSNIRAALERIAKSLGIVGLNIGIEGAKSQESEEKFSGFSNDIRGLSQKITGIGKAVHQDVTSAMTIQKSTCREIASGLTQLEELARDAGIAVEDAVGQVERITNVLIGAMESTRSNSGKISQRVGDIVMAIQFHDNMRQRVEHIVQALDAIIALFKKESADQTKSVASEKIGESFSVLEIQAAQLGRIISEIEDISGNFAQAFDKIHNHLDGLGVGLTSLEASEGGGIIQCNEAVSDPINTLKISLKALSHLLGNGQALMEKMQGAAAEASNVAEKVSSYTREIKGISIETHMMALNAIIKSAHLGEEGHVFEVLAQEVKRLSDGAMGFAFEAEQNLTLIDSSAFAFQGVHSGEKKKSKGKGEAEAHLKAGFYEIASDYDRLTRNCLEAQKRSKNLKSDISRVIDSLSFLSEVSEALSQQHQVMESLIAEWRPHVAREQPLTQMEVDTHVKRYTMEEERKIHQEMTGAAAVVATPLIAAPDGSPEENVELFSDNAPDDDGVELFGDGPERVAEEDAATDPDDIVSLFSESDPAEADALDDDVVIFEDFSADARVETAHEGESVDAPIEYKRDDPEEFGDNVELF